MIYISLSRIKKAVINPKAAFAYLKNYLEGKFLKLFSKKKVILEKELSRDILKNLENHFINRKEPKFFNKELLKEWSGQDFIADNARRICSQEFGFLGMNPKKLQIINWHQDIKSGHTWPNLFYLDLREDLINSYNKGWDIKMVWEMSRFQYLVPLSLGFYKTGEEKYLNKWQEFVLDWIEKNPVYYGPNWINAMEAAIRACNWIFSFEIINLKLKESNLEFKKEFFAKFLSSLIEHGRFIYGNLEYAPVRSNHYLSDLAGLVYLGTMFPEFKESQKWLEKGFKGLEKEIQYQVYSDGVDYELSVPYHRFVTEIFLWTGWLCKINNKKFDSQFWEKLKKMIEFSKWYIKPNGLAPQIGDNDNGRFHLVWENFYQEEQNNHFGLFRLYNQVLGKNDEENIYHGSKSFPEAGFYIMKDKGFYLITGRHKCCYVKGGSHVHNDILSFELSFLGEDFIIDPGTYAYTADFKERNKFRSTQMHNTTMIDQQEQNDFFQDPFYINQQSEFKINRWEINDKEYILETEHNGYEKLKCPVVHNRLFVYNREDQSLQIEDKFRGRGDHELEWNFHFAPNIKIWVKEDRADNKEIILTSNKGSIILSVPKILNCVIIEDEYSPSYGIKKPTKAIRLKGFLKQGFVKRYKFLFRIL
jgi:hypothetical protein